MAKTTTLETPEPEPTPRITPWGPIQIQVTLAPGLVKFKTPAHGGYWITRERQAQMPEDLRNVRPFAGERWYEEDCDWILLALAFPLLFAGDEVYTATKIAQELHPHLATAERLERAAKWIKENEDKYEVSYAGTQAGGWRIVARNMATRAKLERVFRRVPELPPVFTREQFLAAP